VRSSAAHGTGECGTVQQDPKKEEVRQDRNKRKKTSNQTLASTEITQITLKTHLINGPLPVSVKGRRLVLRLVRAAVADGERGDAVGV
jgi:hypothetical protein